MVLSLAAKPGGPLASTPLVSSSGPSKEDLTPGGAEGGLSPSTGITETISQFETGEIERLARARSDEALKEESLAASAHVPAAWRRRVRFSSFS